MYVETNSLMVELWALVRKTILSDPAVWFLTKEHGDLAAHFSDGYEKAIIRVKNPFRSNFSAVFYAAQYTEKGWEILSSLAANPEHSNETCFGDQWVVDFKSRTLVISEPYYQDGVVHCFDFSDDMTSIVEFDTIVCDLEESDKPEGYKKNTKFPSSLSIVDYASGAPSGSFTFEVMSEFANGIQMDMYYREPGVNCIMSEDAFDSESTNNNESEETN